MTDDAEDRARADSEAHGLRSLLLPLSDPTARGAYAELWSASPQRTPFGSIPFADAVTRAFGLAGLIAAATDESGAWRAATLVFEKRVGPLRVAALPPLAPYVAPVIDGRLDEAEIHARRSSLDALASALASFTQATLILPPTLTDARPLSWAGWRLETRFTYESILPDGASPEAWSPNTRRLARKAEGTYRIEEDARHARAAATLMRESMARHGVTFRVRDADAEVVARALVEAGMARVFAALPPDGDVPEAALVVALADRTAHYWIAGSRPGPSMTALLAHALPALATAGIATFDWGGANKPPVAEFKRRFGPSLVPVVRARWVRPGLMRLIDRVRGSR